MTEENISNFVLKVSGKAESPKPLKVGHNLHANLEGSIISETRSDNEDGSLTATYHFKPIRIELVDDLGERIRMKDTRSNSQLLRSLVYKKWVNAASNMDFETYYTKVCGSIMVNMDRIIDMASL